MRYVTSVERLAKEEGILETSRENTIDVLQMRFGEVPSSIVEAINRINEVSVLKTLLRRSIAIGSLAEFQDVLDEMVLG